MVASLEQYIAEATSAYSPAKQALEKQLANVDTQLATSNENINRDFAQQQYQLNRNRNNAAETASLQAAGSGGSFGGSANIANRKYYEQSFVPAITQLQSNQATALSNAAQNAENSRTNINTQLANLQKDATTYGTQRYDAALAAEEAKRQFEENLKLQYAQLEAQKRATAAQNAYNSYLAQAAAAQANQGYKNWNFGNGYSLQQSPNGTAIYLKNGRQISAGQFLEGTGSGGVNWNLWNDVWNNGVSTTGVGSDTVNAFNRVSPNSSAYAYLY